MKTGENRNVKDIFKKCAKCGYIWHTQNEFISDPETEILGYQANFQNLELGLFLFNHKTCGTTVAFHASQFTALYNGPIFTQRHTRQNVCPEYCLNKNVLDPCTVECECAYVREIIQEIRRRPKLKREFSENTQKELDKDSG